MLIKKHFFLHALLCTALVLSSSVWSLHSNTHSFQSAPHDHAALNFAPHLLGHGLEHADTQAAHINDYQSLLDYCEECFWLGHLQATTHTFVIVTPNLSSAAPGSDANAQFLPSAPRYYTARAPPTRA